MFGPSITGQAPQPVTHYIAGSQFDTEQGESRMLYPDESQLKTFAFSAGSKSLSIDDVTWVPSQKSLVHHG